MLICRLSFRLSSASSIFYLWHSHLGHVLSSHLKFLVSIEALGNLHTHDIFYRNICKMTKFPVLPFNRNIYVSSFHFDLIHLIYESLLLFPQKKGLILILVIIRFIWWNSVLLVKFNILILSNALDVICIGNTLLINFLSCLPLMEQFIKLYVKILQRKMVCWKKT